MTRVWSPEFSHRIREIRTGDYLRLVEVASLAGYQRMTPEDFRSTLRKTGYDSFVAIAKEAAKSSTAAEALRGALIFEACKDHYRITHTLIEFKAEDYVETLTTLVDRLIGMTDPVRPAVRIAAREGAKNFLGYMATLGFKGINRCPKAFADGSAAIVVEWRMRPFRSVTPYHLGKRNVQRYFDDGR